MQGIGHEGILLLLIQRFRYGDFEYAGPNAIDLEVDGVFYPDPLAAGIGRQGGLSSKAPLADKIQVRLSKILKEGNSCSSDFNMPSLLGFPFALIGIRPVTSKDFSS